ncbi:MAG: hypothetical protein JNK05_40045 [Myxococcales bacterium]|nr:hypothetical protein [Myxococcales bacterium]
MNALKVGARGASTAFALVCAMLFLCVVAAPRSASGQSSLSLRAGGSVTSGGGSSASGGTSGGTSGSSGGARGTALYQADFFSDTRWSEAVREEVRREERERPQSAPQLERNTDASAQGQTYTRGAIDQQVLQSIIMDRTRRVAMNAVADAISAITGPVGDRQYLRQLLEDVASLLTDRTGMQNTLVENLVATVARAVIADAVVRLRLPGNSVASDCAWRRAVFGEDAGLTGAACASFPIKLIEGRAPSVACAPDAPRRPVACAFLLGTEPAIPWLPSRARPSDALRIRAYLVDLAFWSLGRTEVFARQAPIPSCVFAADHPLVGLCRLVERGTLRGPSIAAAGAAATNGTTNDRVVRPDGTTSESTEPSLDEQRAAQRARELDDVSARAAWLSGTSGLVGAIQVAHDLMTLLRPPLNSRLRTLINTVLSTGNLGMLGKELLDPAAWLQLTDYSDWVESWRELLAVRTALDAFVQSAAVTPAQTSASAGAGAGAASALVGAATQRPVVHTPTADALREALRVVQRRLSRFTWPPVDGPAPTPGASPVMAGFFVEGTQSRDPACERISGSIAGWVRDMLSGHIDATAPIASGDPRRTALCVPAALRSMYDATGRLSAPNPIDVLQPLVNASNDLRTAIQELHRAIPDLARASTYGNPGLNLGSIALDHVTEIVRSFQALAAAIERVRAVAESGAVSSMLRSLPDAPAMGDRFLALRRAVAGVSRMLRVLAVLDIEALRDRAIGSVGDAFGALRNLGGPVLARLGPILSIIPLDRQLTIETMLVMLEHITPEDIIVALGVAPARGNWCQENERSLACWLQRIVGVLREVTDVQELRVTVDSNRLVRTLGALGDDFRRRREWRAYFHLTIGLGEMFSITPDGMGGVTTGFVPLMAEQVGIGVASPSFARDRLGFRAGLFGSGLLYRAVLDSRESDAFFFGGFLALDLYELLEVSLAPSILVYPPGTGPMTQPYSFGISAMASVPLGDYLSRL